MTDTRARVTRRSHQAEDPAQLPAQLAEPPMEPAAPPPEPARLAVPSAAAQRTEQAVTSLREDLRELIALLKGRPAEPVTFEQRSEALDRSRAYVEGLIADRASYRAVASGPERLNLELQVAAFLIGERAEPPQLPADHIEGLKR